MQQQQQPTIACLGKLYTDLKANPKCSENEFKATERTYTQQALLNIKCRVVFVTKKWMESDMLSLTGLKIMYCLHR